MNDAQKKMLSGLREQGLGYIKIAKAMGISVNTVKSYCKRHAIQDKNGYCLYCGKPLHQVKPGRKRKFCSDECRMNWWNTHRELVNHRNVRKMICPNCHKLFTVTGSKPRKYCCHECYVEARFGHHEPCKKNIPAINAMKKQDLDVMSLKDEGTYLATMNLAKKILAQGLITRKEYRRFKERMEEKYKPKISTIFIDK